MEDGWKNTMSQFTEINEYPNCRQTDNLHAMYHVKMLSL